MERVWQIFLALWVVVGQTGCIPTPLLELPPMEPMPQFDRATYVVPLRERVEAVLGQVDEVINYKETEDLTKELGRLAPHGIDVYYDNVGGSHLEAAIENMNDFGCCVECGMISTYNATQPPKAPRNLMQIIGKRIRMQGFIVRDHMDDYDQFLKEMSGWIKSGAVVWEETVTEGLEQAPQAFIGLFSGDNLGKSLVHVQHDY